LRGHFGGRALVDDGAGQPADLAPDERLHRLLLLRTVNAPVVLMREQLAGRLRAVAHDPRLPGPAAVLAAHCVSPFLSAS
jgi:hypothetical protein